MVVLRALAWSAYRLLSTPDARVPGVAIECTRVVGRGVFSLVYALVLERVFLAAGLEAPQALLQVGEVRAGVTDLV